VHTHNLFNVNTDGESDSETAEKLLVFWHVYNRTKCNTSRFS